MIDGPGGLGPEARALLDLAREGLSPDAAAIHRMRGKLGAATAGAAAGMTLGIKLMLVSVAIAIAGGAGLYLRRDRVSAIAPPAIELGMLPSAQQAPEAAPPHVEPPPPAPVAHPVRPIARAIAVAPVAVAPPPASSHTASLSREVELVDLAMSSLRGHRPGDALRAVHQHALETDGHGQLAEDAAAIEIEALCQLHDDATTDKLAAFDARFPHSAQRSRLARQCP